ncbi:hypothetical protein [Myroides odoratus]|uniref:hypothetical protein n=1 Tax=Myroides odoratus TaxID=256 RepID=UPI0039AF08A3
MKSAIFRTVRGAVSFGTTNCIFKGVNLGLPFSAAAISSVLSAGFFKYGGSLKENSAAIVAF